MKKSRREKTKPCIACASSLRATLLLLLFFAWASASSHAQSNIVVDGSFERAGAEWTWGGDLGVYADQFPHDGAIFVSIDAFLFQDLNTVPGRDYVLSFATGTSGLGPAVTWGGTPVPAFTNFASAGFSWTYGYCYVHADSNLTRLRFDSTRAFLDDVRVEWVRDPITLLLQPESRTAYEGSSVSFTVAADGPPPLRFQWLFNGAAIPGGTNGALTLTALRSGQAGQYSVVVSNSWSSEVSDAAQLQVVTPPTSPLIVAQPVGDICPAGYGCAVSVVAVGDQPLHYQWRVDGVELPGATNASLAFESIQTTNAGAYSVIVSNHLGTVLSLTANLTVTNTTGGGMIFLDTTTNNAPIYDVDGVTRLSGSNFLAQVYAGPGAEILRPVGAPIVFPTGANAGYLLAISRRVPDVAPNTTAYIQVRAWEAAAGSSYEAARALGGKFGFSRVAPTRTGSFVMMHSFTLRAGEPFFITGLLGVGDRLPDGTQQFILTGEAGVRYLIEKLLPPNNWVPLLTLTNATSTAIFTDPQQNQNAVQLYRARILD